MPVHRRLKGGQRGLKGIKTREEANKFLEYYLPLYNERFSFKAAKEEDLHREIPDGLGMDKVLCIKTRQSVRNDFTIAHNKKLYQITEHVNGKGVIVEERTDGSMLITYNGRSLKTPSSFASMDGIFTMVQDVIAMTFEHFYEAVQSAMIQRAASAHQ
ncbi:MAG: hypothetical protein HY739_15035 [Desulfobacterales bacterium]|nr:hypothetical protein [Desulfobacterales bacterium]